MLHGPVQPLQHGLAHESTAHVRAGVAGGGIFVSHRQRGIPLDTPRPSVRPPGNWF
jgi:hypothetical protein